MSAPPVFIGAPALTSHRNAYFQENIVKLGPARRRYAALQQSAYSAKGAPQFFGHR
jgi:hypothetical protein